ncbi:MAG: ABC transporter ATP-binding protein [Candidatus Nanoperiomorbaceae bacterium]
MNAITVSGLNKTFSRRHPVKALNQASFTVREGSITGFLGPNGAGKSTTMDILLGFINKTAGEAKIFDQTVDVNSITTRRNIGFLTNDFALDKTFTVAEELEYLGRLSRKFDLEYSQSLAKRLNLNWRAKIGDLSTGNYQKVALISALQHQPKLLILDEPTNGLDPLVQAEFNQIIRELNRAGTTVFISSHILSEVSELCDNFIFIKNGHIVANLTKDEIDAQSSQFITVKPTREQRTKLLDFLKHAKIEYNIEAGDLSQTFMQFYDQDSNRNGGKNA